MIITNGAIYEAYECRGTLYAWSEYYPFNNTLHIYTTESADDYDVRELLKEYRIKAHDEVKCTVHFADETREYLNTVVGRNTFVSILEDEDLLPSINFE